MRIDTLLKENKRQKEPEIDLSFLSDSELNDMEEILSNAILTTEQQQRLNQYLKKAEGNVIIEWLNQVSLKGDQTVKQLFRNYCRFCDSNGYQNESLFNFKNKIKDRGHAIR